MHAFSVEVIMVIFRTTIFRVMNHHYEFFMAHSWQWLYTQWLFQWWYTSRMGKFWGLTVLKWIIGILLLKYPSRLIKLCLRTLKIHLNKLCHLPHLELALNTEPSEKYKKTPSSIILPSSVGQYQCLDPIKTSIKLIISMHGQEQAWFDTLWVDNNYTSPSHLNVSDLTEICMTVWESGRGSSLHHTKTTSEAVMLGW